MSRSVWLDSPEYQSFRASVPLKKIYTDDDRPHMYWEMYDCGPRHEKCPIVCLPPISGTAETYFLQSLAISAKGNRIISLSWPPYWSIKDWCVGFEALLNQLDLESVHLLGSALGGFLAQKFVEYKPCRVESLILCNTFRSTSIFKNSESSQVLWLLPTPVLKSMITSGLETSHMDLAIAKSVDFMEERLSCLNQASLASRLTLNCTPSSVAVDRIQHLPMTIFTVWDDSALSQTAKEDLYSSYPSAKLAHLKSGGNFPFLSRSDEFNLFLTIHLKSFSQDRCPSEP